MAGVMIVDDSSLTRIRLKKLFEKMGHEIVAEAVNGLEAVKKYPLHKPDLVTMDVNMPELNGIEAMKQIMAKDPEATIIMVSTEGQEKLIQEVVSSGAKYFVIKPFKPMQLASVVQTILRQKGEKVLSAMVDFDDDDQGGVVLTIDDSKTVLEKLRVLLKEGNHNVLQADSGRKGVDYAVSGKPDLIVLDLNMPDMDGFAVLKELERDPFTRHIPVMILSDLTQRDDVTKAMKYGVVDYVSKRLDDTTFLRKVKVALTRYRTESNDDEENEAVTVKRAGGRTTLLFRRPISATAMAEEMKDIFSKTFVNMIQKDQVVLDLRALLELGADDIVNLGTLLEMLSDVKVAIVAGRHYGALVAGSDLDDEIPLCISHGDLEVYLDSVG